MTTRDEDVQAVMAAVESYRQCERLNSTGIPREYRALAEAAIEQALRAERIRTLVEVGCEHDPECYELPKHPRPCTRCRMLYQVEAEITGKEVTT